MKTRRSLNISNVTCDGTFPIPPFKKTKNNVKDLNDHHQEEKKQCEYFNPRKYLIPKK